VSACGQKVSGRCAGNERFRPWLGSNSALDLREVTAATSSNSKLYEGLLKCFLEAKQYLYHANELSHSGFEYIDCVELLAKTDYLDSSFLS